ncbi:D-alanyl-D-alanine carboxypeptidase [Lachnospiraceae bacterium]|nr:D-alanyl-D-alanine carboxypeptidase [Lachnospiraceae bacterium]
MRKRTALLFLILSVSASGCGQEITIDNPYDVYESPRAYGLNTSVSSTSEAAFFAENLCVADTQDKLSGDITASLSEAAGLFNLQENTMEFGKNIHLRLYPASTTKILTAYTALKHGDLAAAATVTEAELQLEEGSTVCGLSAGDTVTLEELLYGLMLCSGNDAANVIADLVSGSSEEFAKLMNQEALALGATNSHFVNPHGLHHEEHYTTLYDMYLIFQAALQEEKFVTIISSQNHNGTVINASGETISKEWINSNKYLNGEEAVPEGVQVIGGKTGTTNAAGYCLVLFSQKNGSIPYISIVYKADSRENLYLEMTELLGKISK